MKKLRTNEDWRQYCPFVFGMVALVGVFCVTVECCHPPTRRETQRDCIEHCTAFACDERASTCRACYRACDRIETGMTIDWSIQRTTTSTPSLHPIW